MKRKMISFIEITGTILANVYTDIKSPADGIIESLMARENQRVEKDRIIAAINPTDRVALISKNRLQVQQIEEKLNAIDKNSDDFKLLTQELEKARSDLEYAKKMYQTVPVICPMNGLVTQRWTDEGSQIGVKEKILTVSDMNSLVIKAEVNERYFEAIKQGKKLPVILNAYPNDTLTGSISLVYPQVDPVTRSVKFDIKILNFNKTLLPGMMAYIKIQVAVKENAVVVPEEAVLISPDNKNFLFVVNKDSLVQKRIVQTGISSGNKLEIIKGLKENERVVASGQEMLKDSIKVNIMGTPREGIK
ncbi:MAG: efflux RND transporter periplasmic adaptor subunit [Prolixibacteraceae bacterium]|nr:efflux RND transporter periplasmic adaptor subunit [Prolixibacteraceae bacterium]